ncbi:MAG TPA: murein biosynthesis integral membrane protein MurJ [Microthrixaceae bacterium]|nr:murein biosynthesis integral membrane protein MurJ [Microthrixaceae bacterium]
MAGPVTDDGLDRGRLARVSTVVATGTLLSRLTGLLRVVFTAAALGDGLVADSYNLANVAPNIVYELLIGGVLSATLVPLFVKADQRDDRDGPSAILSLAFGGIVALSAVSVAAAPLIARFYGSSPGSGTDGDQYDLLVLFLYLILPEIFFYGLTALLTATLHARRRFVAAAFAPVLNNVVVIAVMALVAVVWSECRPGGAGTCNPITTVGDSVSGQWVVGLGTTAGIAAMVLVLVWAVRGAGISFRWRPDRHDPLVREMIRLAGWTVGYVIANQVALYVVLRLANGAPVGTVTTYTIAFIFFQLPHGLIAVTVMTTFLPELSSAATRGDLVSFRRRFVVGLRMMMTLLLSATALLIVFAKVASDIVLDHGAFGDDAAGDVGATVRLMALGLPAFSLFLYCCRGFYALEDTKTPFQVNAIECVANIAFAFVLVQWDAPGLGAAYGAAYIVGAVVAVLALHRRVTFTTEELRPTVLGLARSLGLAVVVGLVGWGALEVLGDESQLVGVLLAGAAATATFVAGSVLVGADGVDEVRASLARRRITVAETSPDADSVDAAPDATADDVDRS